MRIESAELTHETPTATTTAAVAQESASRRFGSRSTLVWEVALAVALVVSLITACVIKSGKKELFVDEGFAISIITDSSFLHSMHALHQAADGGMPLYYIVARPWIALFGSSLLSLRLFSCLAICAGLLIMWRTLARLSSPWTAMLALLAASVTCPVLLDQNVEVRFYGLYFLCAAAVFALHLRLIRGPVTNRLVLATAGMHCLLILSHPFGILFSGFSVLALVATDLVRGSFRLSLYAKLCASWLILLILAGEILNVADIGKPHNWTTLQTMEDMLYFLSPALMAVCIVLAVILSALGPREIQVADRDIDTQWSGVILHGIGFLLVPITIGVISWAGHPMFVDRYFLPSTLGAAAILAYILHRLIPNRDFNRAQRIGITVMILAMIQWPVVEATQMPPESRIETIRKSYSIGLPVMLEDSNTFIPLVYYGGKTDSPYYYVMDWDAALHSLSLHATVQYKLLRNARSVGYYPGRIIDNERAICDFPKFIVLDSPGLGWFEERIKNNPDFSVQRLGSMPSRDPGPTQAWLVTRISPSSVCNSAN